jgi:hypothetical protein
MPATPLKRTHHRGTENTEKRILGKKKRRDTIAANFPFYLTFLSPLLFFLCVSVVKILILFLRF